MTNERKSEILKAAVSGMSAAEIAAVEDLPEAEIALVIADGADEMEAIRQHLRNMGWLEDS